MTAPQYPQDPYGANYQQPQAPQPSKTNTLSYVSLILAFVMPVAGAIVGHISLKQIKTSGEEGRGMALAGVIIGWILTGFLALYFLLVFIVVIAAITSSGGGLGGPSSQVCSALDNLNQASGNIFAEKHLFDELAEAYADQPDKQRVTEEFKDAILSGTSDEQAKAAEEFDRVTADDQFQCGIY